MNVPLVTALDRGAVEEARVLRRRRVVFAVVASATCLALLLAMARFLGRDGFDATLWIVPIVFVALAAAGIAVAVKRWRGNDPPEAELPPPLSPEDARRLDAELGT